MLCSCPVARKHGAHERTPVADGLDVYRDLTVAFEHVERVLHLTEEDEGPSPYRELLAEGLRYARRPIRDFDCPSREELRSTLDLLDAELARGEAVYVHCQGGRGRTGTVVGCWLVRHGASGDEALARIAELRRRVPGANRLRSPETPEQRRLVLTWDEA